MLRQVIIFSVCAVAAASLPGLYQSHRETILGVLKPDRATVAQPVAAVNSARPQRPASGDDLSGRKVRLAADQRGHFSADFRLNGRMVTGMIDTGATAVAINRSTARRIGISLQQSDFSQQVDTANGRTGAAFVVIDRLEIGRISVDKVPALVLEDKALSGTLIGMSFLSRLGRYQVENGSLLLVQ